MILSQIDQEPDFTKSVADLLQSEINGGKDYLPDELSQGSQKIKTPVKMNQSSGRKAERLMKQFESKNKVSSRLSYDKRTSIFADQLRFTRDQEKKNSNDQLSKLFVRK